MHATLTYPTLPCGRFFTRGNVRGYRFGFNGKEKVDEVYGDANAYDFGARLYDPRLGRWLAVDPLASTYPDLSPYNFVANCPIFYIDPDGKKIVTYDKESQAIVLGYLNEQFGAQIFKFNANGELRLDKKAYNLVKKNFKPEQVEIFDGITTVVNSTKIIEVRTYTNANSEITINPLVEETTIDPQTGEKFTEYKPMYDGKGVVIQVMPEGLFFTFDDESGVDRAFLLIDIEKANQGTFNTSDGGKTLPSASSVFIHELLDHGLDYLKNNMAKEPDGSTQLDKVNYHNKALRNVGSKERDGSDHE